MQIPKQPHWLVYQSLNKSNAKNIDRSCSGSTISNQPGISLLAEADLYLVDRLIHINQYLNYITYQFLICAHDSYTSNIYNKMEH